MPTDHKWYMRYLVSEILCDTLIDMDPKYPEVTSERLAEFEKLRDSIAKELPEEKLEKFRKKNGKSKS